MRSKAIGFYKEDGKTKPITKKKSKSSYHGQATEPFWKESSIQDVKNSHPKRKSRGIIRKKRTITKRMNISQTLKDRGIKAKITKNPTMAYPKAYNVIPLNYEVDEVAHILRSEGFIVSNYGKTLVVS